MNILLSTLPIFLIIAAGYVLTRLHIAENRWITPLNNFVYYIALPALTIQSLMKIDLSSASLQRSLVFIVLASLLATLIFAGISRIAPFPHKTQVTIFLVAILGNTVFLGIPLATVLTPDVSSEVTATFSVVFFSVALVMSLIIIELWLKNSRKRTDTLTSLATNPIIISLIVGLFFAYIPIPESFEKFLTTPLQLLAQTASPLALFALGGFLTRHRIMSKKWPAITLATGLKLILLPVFFALAMYATTNDTNLNTLMLVLAATPTAVTAFVLTEKYKLDSELAADVMLVSTLFSIVTIPLFVQLIT